MGKALCKAARGKTLCKTAQAREAARGKAAMTCVRAGGERALDNMALRKTYAVEVMSDLVCVSTGQCHGRGVNYTMMATMHRMMRMMIRMLMILR